MLRVSPRVLLLACAGSCLLAGAASADPAPIVYAGQGGSTQTASLAGGGERSYGYGGAQNAAGPRRGAVIDIRRNASARVTPVANFTPAVQADDADDEQGAAEAAPTPPAQADAPAGEQGAQPWLERERVGPPYQANGQWYVPTPEPGYEQTGTASWYGPNFNGQRTASGEVFDQTALTAAHPTLPIPSLVQVTNLENGREVIVRVNDRGPFVGGRLIDVSQGAAQVLGMDRNGVARVHIRYLGPAPRHLNADGTSPVSPTVSPTASPTAPAVEDARPDPTSDQPPEQGPASLLPPPSSAGSALAGAPVDETPRGPPALSPEHYAAETGAYFVQVGAYSDPSNAQRVRDAVGAAGPVSVDVRRSASGAELFRVRLGPWNSREEADAAQRRLASLGYGETIIASR